MAKLSREQQTKLVQVIKKIAEHQQGASEWQESDYFWANVKLAQTTLTELGIKFIPKFDPKDGE